MKQKKRLVAVIDVCYFQCYEKLVHLLEMMLPDSTPHSMGYKKRLDSVFLVSCNGRHSDSSTTNLSPVTKKQCEEVMQSNGWLQLASFSIRRICYLPKTPVH